MKIKNVKKAIRMDFPKRQRRIDNYIFVDFQLGCYVCGKMTFPFK